MAKKQEGGLRLDSPAGWKQGGDSGPALIPGKPDESLLITAVSYVDKDLQMPPKQPLAVHRGGRAEGMGPPGSCPIPVRRLRRPPRRQ